MQHLALREAQNFILRAGNSGRGHCVDRRQIYMESSTGVQVLSTTDNVFGKCYCRVLQNIFGFDLLG